MFFLKKEHDYPVKNIKIKQTKTVWHVNTQVYENIMSFSLFPTGRANET